MPNILLEVNQAHGKNKDITFAQCLGDQAVLRVGSDEAYQELAFKDSQDLGGAWVGVGSIDAPWGIVDANQRDAKSVETWDLDHIHRGYLGAGGGVGVFGHMQPTEEEVISFHQVGVLAN